MRQAGSQAFEEAPASIKTRSFGNLVGSNPLSAGASPIDSSFVPVKDTDKTGELANTGSTGDSGSLTSSYLPVPNGKDTTGELSKFGNIGSKNPLEASYIPVPGGDDKTKGLTKMIRVPISKGQKLD